MQFNNPHPWVERAFRARLDAGTNMPDLVFKDGHVALMHFLLRPRRSKAVVWYELHPTVQAAYERLGAGDVLPPLPHTGHLIIASDASLMEASANGIQYMRRTLLSHSENGANGAVLLPPMEMFRPAVEVHGV